MSDPSADHLSIIIDQKLTRLSPIPCERNLFRVHNPLRKTTMKVYEPDIIAIGPYHRGNPNLQETEEQKLRYVQQILRKAGASSVHRCIIAMRELEEKARKYYAESINLSEDDFVEMMLLDGCFLLEFLLSYRDFYLLGEVGDSVFEFDHIRYGLRHDLLLFENQLPFFILIHLAGMIGHEPKYVVYLAQSLIALCFSGANIRHSALDSIRIEDIKHLLGLAHYCMSSSFAEMVPLRNVGGFNGFINCTTVLQEAGIQIKKAKESTTSLLDISFTKGVLEIPPLFLDDSTESLFANLIAYEQYHPASTPKYVTDYIIVMHCLINSSKDVELLRHCEIINDVLGNDDADHAMLTRLAKNAVSSNKFCYSQVFNDVNVHCRHRRNVWMANLRRNYFNTPWAIISFLAAFLLLFLTLTQTVFSILPHAK
ncbi:unnamed protein product [Ilex paraguariensis]|uniref:Uncharacterized protein n=1 Tax=Ilex paraguariensis TaxID=185542 RepID=A0ABC8TTZ4_9AQUA